MTMEACFVEHQGCFLRTWFVDAHHWLILPWMPSHGLTTPSLKQYRNQRHWNTWRLWWMIYLILSYIIYFHVPSLKRSIYQLAKQLIKHLVQTFKRKRYNWYIPKGHLIQSYPKNKAQANSAFLLIMFSLLCNKITLLMPKCAYESMKKVDGSV